MGEHLLGGFGPKVARLRLVDHLELRIDAYLEGVLAQDARKDRVERTHADIAAAVIGDHLRDALAQHVGRGEEPAAAAGFLVGDFQRRHLDGEFLAHGARALGAEGDAVQLALGEGECGDAALGAGLIVRAEALKQGRSNRLHR